MNHNVAPAELTLVNGDTQIRIRPLPANGRDPIMCKSWDLGAPDVRYTAVPNPGADGVTESPGFLGARQVTLDLQILGDRVTTASTHDAYWYVAQLTKMTHPSAATLLKIRRVDESTHGQPWYMRLRGNPYSIAFGQRAGAVLEMQLSFTCNSGLLESSMISLATQDLTADDAIPPEWIFPAVFPKTFGPGSVPTPAIRFTLGGDAAVAPVIYISGPCADPEIISEIPGEPDSVERFRFTGLTLASGESVGVDMESGSIWRGGIGSAPIADDMATYAKVDWTVSTYWVWQPGPRLVTYPNVHGAVTVQYSERRFTI